MIQSSIRMTMPRPRSADALRILKSLVDLSRDDPGCISCHIYGDLQEEDVLMLEEVWNAEHDLERHIRSDEYRNLLLVLEMALKKPEIRFFTLLNATGIETIEKARNYAKHSLK